MAFADPQSVTINAIAYPMPRTGTGPTSGTFTHADKVTKLSISHRNGKNRDNRLIRLDHSKVGPDPVTSEGTRFESAVWLVVDAPEVGYTIVELKQIVDGFLAMLTASSGAKITQLLGGEN
jgi:hypothetical protein